MANLSHTPLLRCSIGSQVVALLFAVVRHPRALREVRTTALVRTAYFVTLPLQKSRKNAVRCYRYSAIGPDTSTGRVRLGCRTEKLTMTLTSREWEVATLVAKGLSNKEIARHLNAREGTVKIHLHNIYEKLAVKNRTVLALMTQRVIESGSSEDRKGGAALAEAVAAA
jgi:DNA-binding CsgD family transcriptional regulator